MTTRSALLFALLAAAACKDNTVLVGKCTSDDQCPPLWHCATSGPNAGDCLCNNDQSCPQDAGAPPSTCNPSGFCQVKIGCTTNVDCDPSQYCDTVVGECSNTGCTTDLQCPIGEICDRTQGACVPGCHSNGDCPLQVACVCSTGLECQCPADGGTDPAVFDRTTCEIGQCRLDTCAGDTSLCPYNDDCVSVGDGGLSDCEPDPRMGVLCQNCTIAPGASGDLCSAPGSQGANFCLIDLHGGNLFCGVDCSQGQACPSGYACNDVVELTQNPCTSDSQCVPSTLSCTSDASCPADTQCIGSGSKHCGGFCVADEGNGEGFCTCVTNADCPQDTCDKGTCRISQQPCVVGPDGDAKCRNFVSCVDFQGVRGCLVGRNCAPTHGLHCPINVNQ